MIKALIDKIESVGQRLSDKLDAVAADLFDHRRDTEFHSHHRVCKSRK